MKDKKNQAVTDSVIIMTATLVVMMLLSIFLSSCATKKEITDNVKVKIEYRDREILKHDSIYIEGDTQIFNDTVYRTRIEYRYKYFRDTVKVASTDTIYQNITEIQEVNRLTPHQQKMISYGRQFIALLILVIIYCGYRIYKRFRK